MSEKLHTEVAVGHVRVGLLNSLLVQEVYIEDQSHDTLLYAGELQVRITDWFIFKETPVIHYIGLSNTRVNLSRKSDSATWNYDFIAEAFAAPSKKDNSNSKPVTFDLEKVELQNVRIHMDDAWIGEDMHYDIGYMSVDANDISFKSKMIDIGDIDAKNSLVYINEYTGGRPKHLRPKHIAFDTTPFNTDNWQVKISNIHLDECHFKLKGDEKTPEPGLFDENHLDVTSINLHAKDIFIVGDTINGRIEQLSATERCGLAIKKMRSKVTVSPIASICDELYLETNHSILHDYYAMRYKHFPDFNNYIDSVVMEGHFNNAIVDKRDVMFFAPELNNLPPLRLTVSGRGGGCVSNLYAGNLSISDGISSLSGHLSMTGLPDIYTTLISYTEGSLQTTGKGILKYAPYLSDNPNVNVDSLRFLSFSGCYEGYIENFNVDGKFKSNLGNITTTLHMSIPGFVSDSAKYSGKVVTDSFNIGQILKQPIISTLTMNEHIEGESFNADFARLRLSGTINEIGINGYKYHNISTHGTLAKKQFDGNLIVDDPNLALTFDGRLNYGGKQLKIDATAHLLAADFRALLLTPENITASADFDLNWTGSTIDNFTGFGKLSNIDLQRNAHKLAIDSIFVQSIGDSTYRVLNLRSDAFVADITGSYQLTNLPASVQYYLSGYIPNYINAPKKYAPDQNISFRIVTAQVDSIFAVSIPEIRGFDNSTLSGKLNTSTQKLSLTTDVPYGSIGNIHMSDISISGEGDFNSLALNTTVGRIAIGDSLLKGAMSLTTTVGNDTVTFVLATMSPDKNSSISLNGEIVAHNDTLRLSILPSEFYLNKAKWNILGGSKIVFSKDYLYANGLTIKSGLQRVTAKTNEENGRPITIHTENLDIAQLGDWLGFADYQADGRINGNIVITDLFNNLNIDTKLRASEVKLGKDTIGSIYISGTYNEANKQVKISPQTGIYRDKSSVIITGVVSLDSATRHRLKGSVSFHDARVSWASPFLTGLMSNLAGSVNGSVEVWGTDENPVIDGRLSLKNAALKLDYMGCNYTIPFADVSINNKRIELGKVTVLDRYKNEAILSGHFSHNLFNRMRMHLKLTSPMFEVMNLNKTDNDLFYGKMIASVDSFTIKGAFDNVRLQLYNGAPAAKSTIYIPIISGGYVGGYSYVSFKNYGSVQEKQKRHNKDRLSIDLDANLNKLAEIHIVLDPNTDDEIVATGTGNIQMEVPPDNDIRITGLYTIDQGTYTLTFQQVKIRRQFKLNSGSTISFNGPFAETNLAVNATYSTKARLYDLLTESDKTIISQAEMRDAQTAQQVNVILHMNGPIYSSKLTFDIDLENKQSQGSMAQRKLMLINNNDRQKFDQVAALLLVGAFITPDGIGTAAVKSGAINNVSQIISGTLSKGLTNMVNKIIGDRNLNVALKYTNYNYSDQSTVGNINRSQLKLGITKNYFDDRLLVSVGSTSDWGKPATTSAATNFNVAGDFRMQYLLSHNSGLRLNAFHTSDYDLTIDRNIQRSGMGISWRKSFNTLGEFFRGNQYARKLKEKQMQAELQAAENPE